MVVRRFRGGADNRRKTGLPRGGGSHTVPPDPREPFRAAGFSQHAPGGLGMHSDGLTLP